MYVICCWSLTITDDLTGPFELTKLSAQVSVLMAERNVKTSVTDPLSRPEIAKSYQNKGTFQTAREIIRNRGLAGLYSGFSLHLCMHVRSSWRTTLTWLQYEIRSVPQSTL
jgi:hypothetical protein